MGRLYLKWGHYSVSENKKKKIDAVKKKNLWKVGTNSWTNSFKKKSCNGTSVPHTPEGEVHLGHQGPLLDGEAPGVEELAPGGVVQPTLPHGDGPPRLEELLEPGQDLRGQTFGFLGVTAVSVLDPGVRVREGLARPEARPALVADREPKHTIGNSLPVPEELDARYNKQKQTCVKKHTFVCVCVFFFFSKNTFLCVFLLC